MKNLGAPNSHENRLTYRADIQGLRAIAILLVVAAHAKVSGLAGGFIGVDVFFVLSGFLITGLLTQELTATGSIQFLRFYARRFQRLLPAMLLVLACTCIAAAIFILPGGQVSQASAAAAASVWLSNFHFAFSNIDYFGPSAENNLFLHTWSLGVEEQFYLVWPALLIFIAALPLGSKFQGKVKIKIAMFAVVGISLVSCVLTTQHSPELAFYMMPWRAWQFALGALAMLYCGNPADVETHSRNPQSAKFVWIGWIGLVLILGSALFLTPNLAYPGAWALIPSIGTACLLMAGAKNVGGGASTFLSLRPMQAIGRVSYSWYLWHWPVLILGATLFDSTHPLARLLLVAISLLLAVLSYRLVESPIRQSKKLIERPSIVFFTSVSLIIVACTLSVQWGNAVSNWLSQPQQQRNAYIRNGMPIIYRMGCDTDIRSSSLHVCAFGKENAKHTAVLVGDSIGAQWFPAAAKIFNGADWRLIAFTKSACPIVDEPIFYSKIGREYTECAQWRSEALLEIQKLKPDVLLIGSAAHPAYSNEQWKAGTNRVLSKISPFAQNIYLIRPTPVLPFNGLDCISGRNWWPRQLLGKTECKAPANSQRATEIFHALTAAANSFKNVKILDLNNSVCPNNKCTAELGGMAVFRDTQHLNANFIESLSPQLEDQLDLGTLVSKRKAPN
ncbi:acyltransferase family protein [Stenotrophobium rhamnosiphilum]|uniref:Acyltransferase n=1 Tax=Stenotrophobium rhamnosiphilum TaxID=2029166 RepID=A0A2T5MDH8_9GAMM|nr:acyltransferase family protein [Stenotrophobium rhamnosiphilum]PTU30619.1 acyltransferase [Stenotrophobium rhamnosiphilum]